MLRAHTAIGLSALTALMVLVGCGGKESSAPAATVKNVILFIGDGMHSQHETAASRYLTGTDNGLSWHAFPKQGYASTWDVTTYDRYAFKAGQARYAPTGFATQMGYDAGQGGDVPSTLAAVPSEAYFLTPLQKFGTTDPKDAKYPATDSASAGTAIACGFKTDDGNIAWLPGDPSTGGNRAANNGSLRTIAEIAREDFSKSIGVVSTVPFTHATPATFVAHNVARGNYYTGINGYTGLGIAEEIITRTQPDVVIGGGHPMLDNPSYDSKKGYISKAMHEALRTGKDFVFVERQVGVDGAVSLQSGADRAASERKRLFGLFGGSGGNFEPPLPDKHPTSPSCVRGSIENPLLKDATLAALKVLKQNPNGFFLMVEQGDIDWANHANDYQWMIGAMWDLDEAVKATLAYLDQPGDELTRENTLILLTSDHGNSFMKLDGQKRLGKGQLPLQQKTAAWASSGALIWDDRTESLRPRLGATPAAYTSPYIYPGGEVTYGSGEHTNELVTLAASGATPALNLVKEYEGIWYGFGGRNTVDNTHLFHIVQRAFGGRLPQYLAPRR